MEALYGFPVHLNFLPKAALEPNTQKIKEKLLKQGVSPTPKIIHTLRKKEIRKSARKYNKTFDNAFKENSKSPNHACNEEDDFFATITREYKGLMKEFSEKIEEKSIIVGRPWEGVGGVNVGKFLNDSNEYTGDRIKREHLDVLKEMLTKRNGEGFEWLVEGDDVESGQVGGDDIERQFKYKRSRTDADRICWLVERLRITNICVGDWMFSSLMNRSGLHFTEGHLLRIVEMLGYYGNWRQALSVVEWVYNEKKYRNCKSRFVYTKLLAVLGKARRSVEALHVFNTMLVDCQIYPDMAAYHSIAVTLGQGGLLKELLEIIEQMRQKPSKRIKHMRHNWDPCLDPDLIILNSVLNACIPSKQWKGVTWVFEQFKCSGIKPSEATYGLAMEVMLKSQKYDLVHKLFDKMRRSGMAMKALTYKVLVKAFWKEGKTDEAVKAVKDMELRGVVGTDVVYYELACCLCSCGRWKEALEQVEKMMSLPRTKQLEISFTGLIKCCKNGGHLEDCISIFNHMKYYCTPNIGTINMMLEVYGQNDMFAKAKELFEAINRQDSTKTSNYYMVSCAIDAYSYRSMLKVSSGSHQWEYFEYVYKEMTLSGYQLDPVKDAWILLEASKYGKWHLLEHAFDTMLESGQIPHYSLFMEKMIQYVVLEDYERAVHLVKCMIDAHFNVNEKKWADAFRRRAGQIAPDKLQKFLNLLCDKNSPIILHDAMSSLLKYLQSVCSSSSATQTILKISDGSQIDQTGIPCKNDIDKDEQRCTSSFQSDYNSSFRVASFSDSCKGGANNVRSFEHDSCVQQKYNDSNFLNDQTEFIEMELDIFASRIEELPPLDLPSAVEILESWRQKREKGALFF